MGPYAQHLRLQLQQADLGLTRDLLQALPLPPSLHQPLARWQPDGQLQHVQLRWSTGTAQPELPGQWPCARPAVAGPAGGRGHGFRVGTPGVQGLDIDFDLNERGGSAQLRMRDGLLQFPGVFEEPDIALDHLQARLQWAQRPQPLGGLAATVSDAQFANADAQGRLQARWHTGADAASALPGVLHLQGRLSRADGTRVHRYLPLQIPAQARHYVRDSVQAGHSRQVDFEVSGDLRHMPFTTPEHGRFYIRAAIEDAVYDYAPQALLPHGQAPWPKLEQLSGALVFEGAGMQVQGARARVPRCRGGSAAALADGRGRDCRPVPPRGARAGQDAGSLPTVLQVLRGQCHRTADPRRLGPGTGPRAGCAAAAVGAAHRCAGAQPGARAIAIAQQPAATECRHPTAQPAAGAHSF